MLFRIFKYSVKNTLRNKFLSISTVLVLTLLMFFINILAFLEDISYKLINSINSKLTISLYVNEEYTQSSLGVTDLINNIKNVSKEISVTYKDKEEIIKEIELKEPNLVKILEKNNPLPDTIVVSNIKLNEYEIVNSYINEKSFLLISNPDSDDYFANYNSQYKKIESIISILTLLKTGLNFIIGIFIFSISVIMYSVISNFIYYYRDEIYITKLVWWSNIFIYGPFVIQGIIYSTISFALSIISLYVLVNYLKISFWEYYDFSIDNYIFLIEFLVFLSVWAISWFFSSRRHLR